VANPFVTEDPLSDNSENGDEPLIHILEIAGNAIVGGMETYVHNLVCNLPEYGIKVTCLAPYESAFTAGLREQNSEVFITEMAGDPPWRSIQFTVELVRQKKIHAIHAHLPRAHILGGLVGRLANIPVVATIHGMDLDLLDLGAYHTTGTHLIVVCQQAYAQALIHGVNSRDLTLIHNGVDTGVYSPRRSWKDFRTAIQLPRDAPLVGFVGRLAWEKGPDDFIRAAEYVHARLPDVHFVIVGEGPMEAELREMTVSSQLENTVHMTGLMTETWKIYPAFSLLAQTSRVEGMPLVLLEAMACGLPVAAMGIGGVPEIVEVGSTGLLSAPGDWVGLGEALVSLLNAPDRITQMGRAARERVERYFDLNQSIRLSAELFHGLVKKARVLPGSHAR
jgi:glycosyltransferase involved in cell wall biosynthesis